jgi:hypothetical protein
MKGLAQRHPLLTLFVLGVLYRCVLLVWVISEGPIRSSLLPFLFDGHCYITIASDLPTPFRLGHERDVGWMPGTALLIRFAFLLTRDYALAATAVTILASSCIAPALYFALNKRPGAFRASLLILVGTPMVGVLSICTHSEAAFLPLAILTFGFGLRAGCFPYAALAASAATMMRMPGIGLTLCLMIMAMREKQGRALNLALSVLPLLTFMFYELYLRVVLQEFPGLIKAHSANWGLPGYTPQIGIPFRDLLRYFERAELRLKWDIIGALGLAATGLVMLIRKRQYAVATWSLGVLLVGVSMTGLWATMGLRRVLVMAIFAIPWALADKPLKGWLLALLLALLSLWSFVVVPEDCRRAKALQNSYPALWAKILQNESARFGSPSMLGLPKKR